ncbi:MAG: hypothetical protein Q9227_005686 [Pyrenula ochraceoflavens]
MSFYRVAAVSLTLILHSNAQSYVNTTGYDSPQVYPSPNITGAGGWTAALAQAQGFVNELSLDEKVYMVTGVEGPCVGNIPPIPRLSFNGLCLQDGPLAIRQADYASVFPAGLSVAASWDADLAYQRGVYMANEFKGKGANVALGPVVGPLGRHALAGRNWEGFSPDPMLTGAMVNVTVSGMQSTGLQACTKHYIGNEQETQRNPSTVDGVQIEAVSSNIDDRTMHEAYLWPFAEAVKAGTASIMCSYNRINGSYGCQNSKTLNGLLKTELAFQGYVMSDWGATHSGVPAIQDGLDMDMPGPLGFGGTSTASFFGGNLTMAINNGSIPMSRLDDMILRVMTPYYYLGQQNYPTVDPDSAALNGFDPSTSNFTFNLNGTAGVDVRDNHAPFIRQLGAASAVLLKNVNNTLPLKAPKNIGVFGNDAADESDGLYSPADIPSNLFGFNFGALYVGGGSGTGRLTYIVSPLEAIKARGAQDGALVQYITNNAVASSSLSSVFPTPEVCLVFLKTYVTEGRDRTSLEADWNSTALVTNVAKTCSNTVVITHSGGINTMPWADNPNVTAIVAAHLPGQEIGNSIVDVLYGVVNPSGKLPYTIAYQDSDYIAPIVNDTGSTDSNAWQSNFSEGLLIDYRHFDAANITPRYEFGYGLSYSTFTLSNLVITPSGMNLTSYPTPTSGDTPPGGNSALYDTIATAAITVTNTGTVDGATVAQLYVGFPQDSSPAGTPPQVLRGFGKVMLAAGASQTVTMPVTRKDLSFWDVVAQDWKIPSGAFDMRVGSSSRDIAQTQSVSLL